MGYVSMMPKVAVLLFALLVAVPGSPQNGVRDADDDQSLFCADIPVTHSASIPKNVLSVLLQTDAGRDGFVTTNECIAAHRCNADRNDPATLFRAIEVHLASRAEADLLVIGICPMCGVDNDWFWLVRSVDKQPTVVLWAGGNCIQLLRSQTNGLSDVQSAWSSGAGTSTRTYRFNGRVYKQRKEQWREDKP